MITLFAYKYEIFIDNYYYMYNQLNIAILLIPLKSCNLL